MSRDYHIDPDRTVPLGNGWRASVCIGPDGHEHLWLVSPAPQRINGCACRACAPHDQLDAHRARTQAPDTTTGSNT